MKRTVNAYLPKGSTLANLLADISEAAGLVNINQKHEHDLVTRGGKTARRVRITVTVEEVKPEKARLNAWGDLVHVVGISNRKVKP